VFTVALILILARATDMIKIDGSVTFDRRPKITIWYLDSKLGELYNHV